MQQNGRFGVMGGSIASVTQTTTAMKTALLSTLILVSFSLAGCVEDFYFTDYRLEELERAERKWNRAYIVDYDYDGFHDDPFGLDGYYSVSVRNGRVTKAYDIDTGHEVPNSQLHKVPTVHDLFGEIYRALERDFDVLDVDYHPDYGFPSYLYLDVSRHSRNDEYSIEITDMYLFLDQKYDQPMKISGSTR